MKEPMIVKDFRKFCFKVPKEKYDARMWATAHKWFFIAVSSFFLWLTSLQVDHITRLVYAFK